MAKDIATSWTAPDGATVYDFETLADKFPFMFAHALTYGFNKICQDAVSGDRKKMTAEGKPEAEIDAYILAEQMDRLRAIENGEVGLRGPRGSKTETVFRDVVTEWLKRAAASANKKLPKVVWTDGKDGHDGWNALVTAWLAKPHKPNPSLTNKEAVDAEVVNRMSQGADLDF